MSCNFFHTGKCGPVDVLAEAWKIWVTDIFEPDEWLVIDAWMAELEWPNENGQRVIILRKLTRSMRLVRVTASLVSE